MHVFSPHPGGRMIKISREEALEYHRLKGKPGKIEVVPTKPMDTQRDLALAYTPGVAVPGLEIEKNAELAYEYTSKGNLVAVGSNGTAQPSSRLPGWPMPSKS